MDMASSDPNSERLGYRRLTAADLDVFHELVIDSHVRRYLLDGERLPREWSAKEIRSSQSLFHERGVRIRLVFERIGERTRDALRRMKTSPGGTPLLDARANQGKLVTGRASYGFHWQDGDLVENAPETKMVVIIRGWAGRRDRPTVIAPRLNHQGYSTRSRGRWHHHHLGRLLGRPY